MFTFLLWCILFVLCWPLALLALIAYPFVWLLLLPFRIVGIAVHGVLEVIFWQSRCPSACWQRHSASDCRSGPNPSCTPFSRFVMGQGF